MITSDEQSNGLASSTELSVPATPPTVREWAEACVRFVERATTVRLDFTSDTLSVLDHYTRSAAAAVDEKAPAAMLAVTAVGAYLGEVIRHGQYAWWHAPDEDPRTWQVRFGVVFLRVTPFALAAAALAPDDEELEEGIELDEAQQEDVTRYLSSLPAVEVAEYRLPSTRYDTISTIVEYLRAVAEADGLGDMRLTNEDYA